MNLKDNSKELCMEYTPSHGAEERKEAGGSGTQTEIISGISLMHHRCKFIKWSEIAKYIKSQLTAQEMSMLVLSIY